MRISTLCILVGGLLLMGCHATRPDTAADADAPSAQVAALASEYRQLRQVKGHFSGGQWDDRVDNASGRKHAVMAQLGNALAGKRIARRELEELLGPPDAVEVHDSDEVLLYFWRGRHDYLIIGNGPDGAIQTSWYFALE